MAKENLTRLDDTLDAVEPLKQSFPRAFGNVSAAWLHKTLFDVLDSAPYIDIDELSEEISRGDRGPVRFSATTRLRHLKRLTLLIHRILGYHSGEQTRLFKQQILKLDDARTASACSLALARGVQLAGDSLHDWLIKTTMDDGGALVHYYSQGEDARLHDMDITEGGWCLGVSTQWVRFRATGRNDFWQWLMTEEGAAACRFVMASQGVRGKNMIAPSSSAQRWERLALRTTEWSGRASFALRRFGVIEERVARCDSPQTATPLAMADNIIHGPYGLRRIGQSYVRGGGHAMAADTHKSFTFMDPNAGEVQFTSGPQLRTWLPKFVRRIRYEFAQHYVEYYQYYPNRARKDTPQDVLNRSEADYKERNALRHTLHDALRNRREALYGDNSDDEWDG